MTSMTPVISAWRKNELFLLFLAGIYLMAGAGAAFLLKAEEQDYFIVMAAGAIFFTSLLVSLFWRMLRFRGDQYLLPLAMVFCATGLVFLQRINPGFALRQFVWLMAGLTAMFLTTLLLRNFRVLSDYKYVLALAGTVALVIPIFFGIEQGGARSWLDFGIFQLQPSEFVKILVVFFLAVYLDENRAVLKIGTTNLLGLSLPGPQVWGPLLGMWGISLLILVFQRDLGTALIYFCTFLAMVYISTSRRDYIISGLTLFIAGAYASYHLFDHVRLRVLVWLDPWHYVDTHGYQVVQSLYAITAGGLTGTGLGAGHPKFIPAVHTDLIFSAVTEEMGMLGGLGLLILYMLFVYRGMVISLRARDTFAALLGAGLTALMGIQAFIIVAGVTKLLPLTGVTLPFISYGGSSIVANFIILGLLLNISHEARGQT